MRVSFFVSIIIMIAYMFLFHQEISYAQTPVLLDKNLQKEGITSPVPESTAVVQQTNSQEQGTSTAVQSVQAAGITGGSEASVMYYPDKQLPENVTAALLITGLLFVLAGTLLVNSTMRLEFFAQSPKTNPVLMSKHFGHNL